jgi:3-hydroxyisobutyrate dehydrogenase-like beta-hydroxyacid dehydrogenase
MEIMMKTLGILHPGEMGISIAASAQNSGCKVYWVSEGRSDQTRRRAEEHNLEDARTLTSLCQNCDLIVSVCPPTAAEEVSKQVLAAGFQGLFLDANAISPKRAINICRAFDDHGLDFVDGSIIGGPAWQPGRTWLYLSGAKARQATEYFSAGPLEIEVIGDEIGKASALKMCFAAYTKGTTALLSAILAASDELGVRDELERHWSRADAAFPAQTQQRVQHVTAKAWRFEGEMKEIASTLASVNIPAGFHIAAEEIYHRMAGFKNAADTPKLAEVLEALLLKQDNRD